MRLGTAGNTQGPALHIIEVDKGYTVIFDCDDESDYSQWIAIKGENEFFAESAEALLGLILIYEIFGTTWNQYSKYDCEPIFARQVSDFLD